MKSKKEKLIKAYFCPKCKSPEVRYVFNLKSIFGLMPRMKCKCGYEAAIFPMAVIDRKKLEKANKKVGGKGK